MLPGTILTISSMAKRFFYTSNSFIITTLSESTYTLKTDTTGSGIYTILNHFMKYFINEAWNLGRREHEAIQGEKRGSFRLSDGWVLGRYIKLRQYFRKISMLYPGAIKYKIRKPNNKNEKTIVTLIFRKVVHFYTIFL